ncbi:MAG: MBL fold metallo-hydrolase [Candidatus Falkowbacteria bacterium]
MKNIFSSFNLIAWRASVITLWQAKRWRFGFFGFIFTLVLFCVSVFTFCLRVAPIAKLEIDFLSVGQGDGTVIKTVNHQVILIDGGPNGSVIEQLNQVLPYGRRRLDLVVLTHPHADHLFGLVEVARRYQIERVIYSGLLDADGVTKSWLESIKSSGGEVRRVDKKIAINLGQDTVLDVYNPLAYASSTKDLNDKSLVSVLRFKHAQAILWGDAGSGVEQAILPYINLDESIIIKVSHHGSESGTNLSVLQKIKPVFAVIEVGVKNRYGHPSLRTIKKLERVSSTVLRTDLLGSITLISDGNIWQKE